MNLCASGLVQINRRVGVLLLTGHDVGLVKTPRLQIVAQGVDQAETDRQAEETVIEYSQSGNEGNIPISQCLRVLSTQAWA
jgi:hypothetical protein